MMRRGEILSIFSTETGERCAGESRKGRPLPMPEVDLVTIETNFCPWFDDSERILIIFSKAEKTDTMVYFRSGLVVMSDKKHYALLLRV